MKLLISSSIFLFAWLPVFTLGLPATFIMLLTGWGGKTTWFGNYLHGRFGNSHTPANPNLWQQWSFLALRNPISNFGKFVVSRGPHSAAWLVELHIVGRLHLLYGWKNADQRLPGSLRPFVFRPLLKE